MERYRLHRKVAFLLLVGVTLLPLACNMPAPISGDEANEGESVWERFEILQAYQNTEPVPTSTLPPIRSSKR
jgi:hypothetical protein